MRAPIMPLLLVASFFSIIQSTDVGMIAYFQGPCPEGWETYIAAYDKFILSAGNKYIIGNIGGTEQETLIIDHIPPHNHSNGEYNKLGKTDCYDTSTITDNIGCYQLNLLHAGQILTVGGGKPHNNMPPYIVLKACKKVNETKVDCTNQFISCDIQRFQNLQKSLGLTDDGIAAFKTKMTSELAAKQAEIAALKAEKDALKIELSNKITETNTLYNAANILIKEINSSLALTDDGIAAFKTKMTTELAAKQAEIVALKTEKDALKTQIGGIRAEKDALKVQLQKKVTETNTLYNSASVLIKELNSTLVATQIKVDLLINLKSITFEFSLAGVQVFLFLLLAFLWQ